jgi:hypothetical protein
MNLSWYAEFAKPVVKDSSGYRFGLFVVNFSDHRIFCESVGDEQDIGIFVHSISMEPKRSAWILMLGCSGIGNGANGGCLALEVFCC